MQSPFTRTAIASPVAVHLSSSIATQLGDKAQHVEAWRGDSRIGYACLCHRTKNARGKFQYEPADVTANFDYVGELAKYEAGAAAAQVAARVPILLDALYEGEITPDELKARLTGAQVGRYDRQIGAVIEARFEREAIEWRTKMLAQGRTTESI